jgi:hypothetical protein
VAIVLLGFAALLTLVYVSMLPVGLWEDGYFGKRFAYNFWQHGSFSWNVADGPIYGMTSQTLQLLGTLIYRSTPHHFVVNLKAACTVAPFLTLPLLWYLARQQAPHSGQAARSALLPWVVGLASVPILELMLIGLESTLTLPIVALSLACLLKPWQRLRDGVWAVLSVLAVYLTRPDAILIPLVVLAGLWALELGPGARWSRARPLSLAGLALLAGLAGLLVVFHFYYGTGLPLPFYLKTRGLSVQPAEYLQFFKIEKTENAVRMLFLSLPFVYIALHSLSRPVLLLLAAALLFCGYHYLATIEIMGYFSRFYLPGLVPLLAAAGLAFPAYQARRRWWLSALLYTAYCAVFLGLEHLDQALQMHIVAKPDHYVSVLVVTGVLLLGPAGWNPVNALAVVACLLVGAVRLYPVASLAVEDDETILLRQIAPRGVFRGLERLRRRLKPKVIYHTDMGAPGVLFPESKVVDLDGLLNEDITLRGIRFEQLCRADRPEAIFVPNEGYERLRREILSGECIKDYVAVVPMESAPLHIRKDLLRRY